MLKRIVFSLVAGLLVGLALLTGSASAGGVGFVSDGKVVVANRASGTISVIDAVTDTVAGTYDLPDGPNPAEPMYVNYNIHNNYVFVGDRANDRVVVFDGDTFDVVATVPTAAGIFHMWTDIHGRQLWVTADIDKAATVIDTKTLEVIATVPMPADLAANGKPHDVIVDREGRYAYVSMLGFSGPDDYVVQFSTKSFAELNRAAVGKDPHLSLTQRTQYLYVPSQGDNVVTVLERENLAPVTNIAVPGAHGAGMRLDGAVFYTTNLPGGGTNGLFAIDPQANVVLGSADTPYPVPHNIALTPDGKKLFVTHSGGTADKVTIYSASRFEPTPAFQDELTVGLNPFGLAYVP